MSNETLDKLSQYGIDFQLKVLGLLLSDKEFLINVYDMLDEEYFENPAHKWIIQNIKQYFHEYHTTVPMDILKIELQKTSNDVLQLSIKESLKKAYIFSDQVNNEYVKIEFTNFIRNQQMKNAIMEAAELLSKGKYDQIRSLITKTINNGEDKNIGHEYIIDLEDRYRDENRKIVPFPYPEWNEITQGGYGSGDLVLLFGAPGSGKSFTVIDMASLALKLGLKVVYYTLELSDIYIGKRFDSKLTGIPINELKDNKDLVEEKLKDVPGKLIIKEYYPGRSSLDDIESHLEKIKQQQDFIPDVIFIDYLDLLKPRGRKSQNRKDNIDDVYVDSKGLAKFLKTPIVSPSQINRDGANDVIAEGIKVAGSFDKIMIGDISISLSRLRKDKLEGTGRYHFIKNRYGLDGISFKAEIDFSRAHIKMLGVLSEDEIENFKKEEKKYKNNPTYIGEEVKEELHNKFLEYFENKEEK